MHFILIVWETSICQQKPRQVEEAFMELIIYREG